MKKLAEELRRSLGDDQIRAAIRAWRQLTPDQRHEVAVLVADLVNRSRT